MPNSLFVFAATLLLLLTLPQPVIACDQHLDRANHYRDLRRAGGTARQMARWQQQRKRHQTRYQDCRLGDRSGGSILTTGGEHRAPAQPDYQKSRSTEVRDSNVRQLLSTCNYWVAEYNNQPRDDRRHYRDTACRAFSAAEQRVLNPPAALTEHQRSLAECIKPGNQLDNEVQACLEGSLEPSWNQ